MFSSNVLVVKITQRFVCVLITATVPRLFLDALPCDAVVVFVFFFTGFFFLSMRFTRGTSSSSSSSSLSELKSEEEGSFKIHEVST